MHLPPDPSAFAVIDGKHRYSVSVAEVELAAEKALIGQFNPRIELVSLRYQAGRLKGSLRHRIA